MFSFLFGLLAATNLTERVSRFSSIHCGKQAFDNFCKIVFFVSFVFLFSPSFSLAPISLFIRVVEKFTPHIICDNCRLRSYRLFSLYQICSVFQPFFPLSVCDFLWCELSFLFAKFVAFSIWVDIFFCCCYFFAFAIASVCCAALFFLSLLECARLPLVRLPVAFMPVCRKLLFAWL